MSHSQRLQAVDHLLDEISRNANEIVRSRRQIDTHLATANPMTNIFINIHAQAITLYKLANELAIVFIGPQEEGTPAPGPVTMNFTADTFRGLTTEAIGVAADAVHGWIRTDTFSVIPFLPSSSSKRRHIQTVKRALTVERKLQTFLASEFDITRAQSSVHCRTSQTLANEIEEDHI